jgi:hypothetical protein
MPNTLPLSLSTATSTQIEEHNLEGNKLKQWRCKNKHILGFIRWNGDGLPQLMVLRDALDMDVEHPHDVDLLGPLDGRMPIRCSICDDVKVWQLNAIGMVSLFMQLDDAEMLKFSQKLLEMSRSHNGGE